MWNQERIEYTDEHERTLRRLTIDEQGPGTILSDFAAFLAYVRGRDLPVSKVNQLPPLKVLPSLNALLSRPIEVRLKRPQLKSYPHVQGLYLLLRATGLGRIEGTGKPTLVIDEELYRAWSALNLTERYFTLLEAWLLRGRLQIVGERDSSFSVPVRQFADAARLIYRAGGEGLAIEGNDRAEWFWYYAPGRMGIALLELFGFLSVVVRAPQEGEGWVVKEVVRTLLGDAVFARLYDRLLGDFDKVMVLEAAHQPAFGALQSLFAPYAPEWQHNLELPSWTYRQGRYVFKASLGRGLWRRIALDAREPLDALAGTILNAYDFDHDHLYLFSYRNRFGVQERVHHPYMDEGPWTDDVRVGDVPLSVGESMTYVFDFGDQWEFEVTLERIDPPQDVPRKPTLLDSQGDAPEQYPNWEGEE